MSLSEPAVDPAVDEGRQRRQASRAELSALASGCAPAVDAIPRIMEWLADTTGALAWSVWLPQRDAAPGFARGLERIGIRRPAQQQQHARLAAALRGATRIIPPRAEIAEGIANPTRAALVYTSAAAGEGAPLTLEIAIDPERSREAQREALHWLQEGAQALAIQAKNRRFAELQQRDGLWRRIDEFSKQVHRRLELAPIAHTAANETCRLLACDRASVVLRRGERYVVAAVSGVDVCDRRSPSLIRLAALCRGVCAAGEAFWWAGEEGEAEPQLDQLLGDYLDVSAAKVVGVTPIFPPRGDQPPEPGEPTGDARPLGALVVESFDQPPEGTMRLQAGVEALIEHVSIAVAAGVACSRVPGFAALRRLTSTDWAERARSWSRLRLAAAIAAAVVVALIVIPAPLSVWCEGRLKPPLARMFAPQNCVVETVHVAHGDDVTAGDPLVALRSDELTEEYQRLDGQLRAVEQEMVAQERRRNDADLRPGERTEVMARISELEVESDYLRRSLALRGDELQSLIVRAPTDGRVVTWNLRDRLRSRPLQRGQRMLEIAEQDGEWTVELAVSERRLAEVQSAATRRGEPLAVDLVLADDHRRRFTGRLVELEQRAEASAGSGGGVLAAVVAFDEPPPAEWLRADVSASGRVKCGWRPLGQVLFGRAAAALRGFLFRL